MFPSIDHRDGRFPARVVNDALLSVLLACADPEVPRENFSGPLVVLLGDLGGIEIERVLSREPSDPRSGRLALITCSACGVKVCD